MNNLSARSKQSNLSYRRELLQTEFMELLLEILPEDGSEVSMVFTDDAGNEIQTVSREQVTGDDGNTVYPVSELTMGDLETITYTLLNAQP